MSIVSRNQFDPRIDNLAVQGVSGTIGSLSYIADTIEKTLNGTKQVYGNASNTMTADEPVKFTIVGGDNAWGTEVLLTDGTVIESGSATKKFSLNTMYVVSVSTANKISVMEYLYASVAAAVTSVTTTDAGDLFTKAGHGLSNGDKIILSSIVATTGIDEYTVYYVVGVAGDDFQVSLTSGGAAVPLTNDGSCSFRKLTQSVLTNSCISMANVNSDAMPYWILAPRIPCNYAISVRVKSESGSTVSIGILLGLNSYDA